MRSAEIYGNQRGENVIGTTAQNDMRIVVIPAKSRDEIQRTTRLNVAAYCRVSTDQEEQENSYEAQISYYTEKIGKNNDWQMAGIFADEGITGTQAKKRPEFLKMIRLCRQRKIEIFLRTLIQCPVNGSVENGLKQRLSADLDVLPKAFFFYASM